MGCVKKGRQSWSETRRGDGVAERRGRGVDGGCGG